MDGTRPGLAFQDLSDSEQNRVVIEMAVELARFEAERQPTILLVDCMARFDRRQFQDYAEFIAAQTRQFQAVVTVPVRTHFPPVSLVEGLHVARLRGHTANVTIE